MNPSKVIVHTKSPCQLYLSSPHRSFLPDHTLILFFSFIITGSVNSENIIILRNAPSGFSKTLVNTNAGFTEGGLQILVYLLWPANSCEIAEFYSTMKAILFSGRAVNVHDCNMDKRESRKQQIKQLRWQKQKHTHTVQYTLTFS